MQLDLFYICFLAQKRQVFQVSLDLWLHNSNLSSSVFTSSLLCLHSMCLLQEHLSFNLRPINIQSNISSWHSWQNTSTKTIFPYKVTFIGLGIWSNPQWGHLTDHNTTTAPLKFISHIQNKFTPSNTRKVLTHYNTNSKSKLSSK